MAKKGNKKRKLNNGSPHVMDEPDKTMDVPRVLPLERDPPPDEHMEEEEKKEPAVPVMNAAAVLAQKPPPKTPQHLVLASKFDHTRHIMVGPFRTYTRKQDQVTVKTMDLFFPSKALRPPKTWLQFNRGYIPSKYGVENSFGKDRIAFTVTEPDAKKNLRDLDAFLFEKVKAVGSLLHKQNQTHEEAVEDDFYRDILGKENPRDDNSTWPPRIKVVVRDKSLVTDHDGTKISIYETAGREFEYVVIELRGFYFQGKAIGVMKDLVALKMAPSAESHKFTEFPYVPADAEEEEGPIYGM